MHKRAPTLILSFTLLVVMLGYGLVMPIMPFYIEHFGAGGAELGWMMSTYALMQLVCAPVWGRLSDRHGRKPILAIGVAGYALSLLFFGLATEFWMLFLARTLSGVLSSATMPTAMAYIADCLPEEERGGGMGQLGAAMGVGVVVGPVLGGYLSTESLALPFFVGSALAVLAFVFVIVALPGLPRRSPPAPAARDRLSLATVGGLLRSPLGAALILILIVSLGLTSFQGIAGLYVIDRFGFDTREVGNMWMVMGLAMVVVQGGLTGPLTRRLGEAALIRIGLAGGAAGFIAMALAVDGATTLLALLLFTSALALVGPALNAHVSTLAGERQGAVMGLNSAATSLGRVIGPLYAGYLYDVNIGLPFLSGALTLGLGLGFSLLSGRAVAPKPGQ